MKSIFSIILLFFVLISCTKDLPHPQSCGPDPNLEGVWISDSSRNLLLDSNKNVVWDMTGPSSFPTNYLKLQFFCQNNTPTFYGEYYQNSNMSVSHDSSTYYVYGSKMYYDQFGVPDTAQMGLKHIDYLHGKYLHIRWTYVYSDSSMHSETYYMHK